MDPELWKAMQAYYMAGQTMPTYYGTGPSPNPDAPELDPFAQNVLATGAPLDVNAKGEPVPFGLDTSKSLLNFQQDVYGSLADPMNAYLSSLMGGEGFAPGAFDPIIEKTPIEQVQGPQLALLAQTGGLQGELAQLIMSGMNAGQAAAEVRNKKRTPEEAAALQAQLPTVTDQFGKATTDWNAVDKAAAAIYEPYLKEQATLQAPGVIQDPETGRYVATKQVDSPQMEFIKKLGIPDPRAQYDLQYALQNDPTVAGLFMQKAASGATADRMRETLDQYHKKLTKQREAEAKAREEDRKVLAKYQLGPQREWANKMEVQAGGLRQSMDDYFRQAARGGPQFQAQPSTGVFSNLPAGINRSAPSLAERPQYQAGPGAPDLPDFSWPGEMPKAPPVSIYSRGQGANADQVASLFNKLTAVLPSTVRPQQQVVSSAERPLRIAATATNRANIGDQNAMFRAMIPYLARQAAGRTPAKDVIQQRLLPLYASGAYGQQGMPNAYPNRNAVAALLGS